MDIYIDTADIDEIKEAMSWGIVKGVTTNPSLIEKAMKKHEISDLKHYIKQIFKVVGGMPVSFEVIGLTADSMIEEGRMLYETFRDFKIDSEKAKHDVVIKVPINPSLKKSDNTQFDGLKAIHRLSQEGIPVNATLIMTPEQALLAANAGAEYISPFAGRIDDELDIATDHAYNRTYDAKKGSNIYEEIHGTKLDYGIESGIHLIQTVMKVLKGYETKVIAASLRNKKHVRESAIAGADIGTIPFSVLEKMVKHKKTYEGAVAFNTAAKNVPAYSALFEK